jgi:hypothetical protein
VWLIVYQNLDPSIDSNGLFATFRPVSRRRAFSACLMHPLMPFTVRPNRQVCVTYPVPPPGAALSWECVRRQRACYAQRKRGVARLWLCVVPGSRSRCVAVSSAVWSVRVLMQHSRRGAPRHERCRDRQQAACRPPPRAQTASSRKARAALRRPQWSSAQRKRCDEPDSERGRRQLRRLAQPRCAVYQPRLARWSPRAPRAAASGIRQLLQRMVSAPVYEFIRI